MNLFAPLLFTPFLVGIIFVLSGFIMLKFPPQNINGFYGYRTPAAMKSQERWDFAQTYASKEMIKLGGVLLLISFSGLLFPHDEKSDAIIGLIITIGGAGSLIASVERANKKRFGKD